MNDGLDKRTKRITEKEIIKGSGVKIKRSVFTGTYCVSLFSVSGKRSSFFELKFVKKIFKL